MRSIFADTSYWIATINPKDHLHDRAMFVVRQLGTFRLITSDMILVEVLNALAEWGEYIRRTAIDAVQAITEDAATEVVPQTRHLFQDAFGLYRRRLDKSWSLTDCASFIIMDKYGIIEALTYDIHFIQKGYAALLRENQHQV
jgi:predicted nucleic acid-binding protein